MNFAALTLVLAFVWASVTGNFSLLNLLLGAGVSVVALWIIREHVTTPSYFKKIGRASSLAILFLYELALSSLRVAVLVVSPNLKAKLKPGIIAFPLTVKSDVQITLLANLITLTPGTLSIDVSEDRKFLYVHAIAVPSKQGLIKDIASGFEAKIIEVFE
ncbi:Na(+) H(+) antiporter subunit E [hydrothermal vent metagenome]|uniref:Na(+) H(+) antiporter subunit E n=1 Tax=hydrothermal vent metagenome TaxID=652676 RepID=A0A3B0TNU4_9ZZZZ